MPEGKRKYLPYRLTAKEKRSPKLRKKLAHCIMKVERKYCSKLSHRQGKYKYPKHCAVNPVAICRAQLEGKRKRRR